MPSEREDLRPRENEPRLGHLTRPYTARVVYVHRDTDVLLVESMLAPPAIDDARQSLEYWQRRQKALPLYRRSARREAREMASRWEGRVRAARMARFEASPVGRFLSALGLSTAWLHRVPVTKSGILGFAWLIVPPKVKLVVGAVAATWVLVALGAFSAILLLLIQLT